MANARFLTLSVGLAAALTASKAPAQGHGHPPSAGAKPSADSAEMGEMADHAMMGGAMDMNMMKHMELTPSRTPTAGDSARARQIATGLKRAIGRYRDTVAAVADGYRLFAPQVK